MAVSTRVEFTHSLVEQFEEGYICHTLLTSIDAAGAMETMATINEWVSLDKTLYLILDLQYQGMVSRSARRVFGSDLREDAVIAFVSRSKVSEVVINFFLRFHSFDYTAHIFANREDAQRWLMAQMELEGSK